MGVFIFHLGKLEALTLPEVTLLLSGSRCVMHISEALGMSQSAVSHQLALLRGADLVKVSRNGKTQVYSIADEHVRLILDMALLHSCEE